MHPSLDINSKVPLKKKMIPAPGGGGGIISLAPINLSCNATKNNSEMDK